MKWAFGFPDSSVAFSQPSVAGGRVFVGIAQRRGLLARRAERLHLLDICRGERRAHRAGRRSAADGSGYAVYFGDLSGHVYSVDAATGRQLWMKQVEDHPYGRITGTPTLFENRLYVPVASLEESMAGDRDYSCCSFRGSLVALNAATGEQVWRTFTIAQPPKPRGKNARRGDAARTGRRADLDDADDRRPAADDLRVDRKHVLPGRSSRRATR